MGMKIWDIVKTVGSGIIREVVPGGGLIVGAINALLPDDKKLSANATGEDVKSAVNSLPPEQRASVMEKEFDVDITQIKESHSTVRAMLEADTKSPHTTRPYIAKGAFHVVAFTVIVVVAVWAYGVSIKDAALVKAVMDGWQFILAAIGPFVVLLHSYFGVLKHEQKNKLDAANGAAIPASITGLLASVLSRK